MDGKHKLFSKVFLSHDTTQDRHTCGLGVSTCSQCQKSRVGLILPPNIPDHISLNIEIPTSLSWIIQPTPEGMIRKEYKKSKWIHWKFYRSTLTVSYRFVFYRTSLTVSILLTNYGWFCEKTTVANSKISIQKWEITPISKIELQLKMLRCK